MLEQRSGFFVDHDIRLRANRIWVQMGRPKGRAWAYWREALAELEAEGLAKSEADPAPLIVPYLTTMRQAMAYMTLTAPYSLGIPSIDEEHGELMDLVNQIHEALRRPAPQDEIKAMFQRFAASAASHFTQEESQFVDTGYLDAPLHARKHAHLLMILAYFQSGIDGMGRSVSFEDQLSFLRDWLLDHIANEDQQFGDFIGAQERPPISAVG